MSLQPTQTPPEQSAAAVLPLLVVPSPSPRVRPAGVVPASLRAARGTGGPASLAQTPPSTPASQPAGHAVRFSHQPTRGAHHSDGEADRVDACTVSASRHSWWELPSRLSCCHSPSWASPDFQSQRRALARALCETASLDGSTDSKDWRLSHTAILHISYVALLTTA